MPCGGPRLLMKETAWAGNWGDTIGQQPPPPADAYAPELT
jgi:hypothetical protein